jgi:hypothetical protein
MLADDRLSGALSELAHSSWEIQCFSVFCIDATPLILVFSAFSIDGRPDLSLVVYNPATPKDVNKICGLIKSLSKT